VGATKILPSQKSCEVFGVDGIRDGPGLAEGKDMSNATVLLLPPVSFMFSIKICCFVTAANVVGPTPAGHMACGGRADTEICSGVEANGEGGQTLGTRSQGPHIPLSALRRPASLEPSRG
jgi:hypothetical protein